jgi:hypothetical protein
LPLLKTPEEAILVSELPGIRGMPDNVPKAPAPALRDVDLAQPRPRN